MPFLFKTILAVFFITPLPFGSNRDWAWLLAAAVCFIMMTYWCFLFINGKTHLSLCLKKPINIATLGLLSLLVCWIFIQSLPFPSVLLPEKTINVYTQGNNVLTGLKQPETISISWDAGITKMSALKSLFYLCIYFLLMQLIDSREKLKAFLSVVFVAGLFQAVYGSFMVLSGVEYLFGVKKEAYMGYATGTFVARNHFAGYLEMAIAFGIGRILLTNNKEKNIHYGHSWRSKLRKWLDRLYSKNALQAVAIMMMLYALVMSGSRMGNVAFFSSLLFSGIISTLISPNFRVYGKKIVKFCSASLVIIVIAGLLGWLKVADRIEKTDVHNESRFDVAASIVPMIHDFSWLGSGAGTFKYVFPGYITNNYCCFEHAHNDYLEILSDMGYIGFVLLAGVVLISLYQAIVTIRHRHSRLVRTTGFVSIMATLSLLIHGFMDFNLHIPANALLFIASLSLPSIGKAVYQKNNGLRK